MEHIARSKQHISIFSEYHSLGDHSIHLKCHGICHLKNLKFVAPWKNIQLFSLCWPLWYPWANCILAFCCLGHQRIVWQLQLATRLLSFTAMSSQGLTLFKLLSVFDLGHPWSSVHFHCWSIVIILLAVTLISLHQLAGRLTWLNMVLVWLLSEFCVFLCLCLSVSLAPTRVDGCPALPSVRPRSAPLIACI